MLELWDNMEVSLTVSPLQSAGEMVNTACLSACVHLLCSGKC